MPDKKIDPMYLEVVKCKTCGQDEYWGSLINMPQPVGQVCRKCAYALWEKLETGHDYSKDPVYPSTEGLC